MKKLISVILALVLLFNMAVPTFATTNDPASTEEQTVDDILNDYHEEIFRAVRNNKLDNQSNSSRSAQTLEEEAVNHLQAAGYEAYHMNISNYGALEEILQTNFDEIGLNPSGSYIIVISGDESESRETTNSRAFVDPEPDLVDPGSGEYFTYTYNGITYKMRYVTITGQAYTSAVSKDLRGTYGQSFVDRLVNTAVSYVLDNTYKKIPFGTIASLLGLSVTPGYSVRSEWMHFGFIAVRVRKYIQIWDASVGAWRLTTYVEHASTESSCEGRFFDATANNYIGSYSWEDDELLYSPNYFNTALLKQNAAINYSMNIVNNDSTGDFIMKFVDQNGNTTVVGTIYAGL